MRRLFCAFAISVLALLGVAGAAAAAPASHHAHRAAVAAHRCPTSTYDWNVNVGPPFGGPYGQADWESNGCNDTMQVKVVCQTISGTIYTVYSGEVKGLEINDRANCDYGSLIDAFLIDKRDSNGWRQLWP